MVGRHPIHLILTWKGLLLIQYQFWYTKHENPGQNPARIGGNPKVQLKQHGSSHALSVSAMSFPSLSVTRTVMYRRKLIAKQCEI